MTDTLKNKQNSNAGLLALQRQLDRRDPFELDRDSTAELDLLAATDGIAIAFLENLSPNKVAGVIERIETILGPMWVLRDESLYGDGISFHGLTALPSPENTPPVGEAWALARQLAVVDGVQSATPLFAQVAPNPQMGQDEQFAFAVDEDGPMDVAQQRSWHLEALQIPKAWQYLSEQGRAPGEGVIVAVVDTGYTDHPEIFERLTKLEGQPDKVRGVDLLGEDDPRDALAGGPPLTFPSHGTSVASVIASPAGPPANNPDDQNWVDGIAPAAQVLPVRVTTNVVLLLPNKITPGIRQAVDAGADVINVSLGLPYYWPALHAAVRHAAEQGVIMVAASGNYWPAVVYPARFPEVLAAANCDWKLREWRWASAGAAVDALVPGVAVQRALCQNQQGQITFSVSVGTGTTFAAACCTGLAALWLSRHGGREAIIRHYGGQKRLVSQAFHYLLRETARVLPEVNLNRYGEGIPQADKLLEADLPTIEELAQDAEGLRLHMTPSVDAKAAVLPGLAFFESDQDPVLIEIRKLLGQEVEAGLLEELLSEVGLHLASRLRLREDLRTGRVDDVRQALLGSHQLSSALRRQLESAGRRSADKDKKVQKAAETFRPREAPNPAHRSLRVYALDPSLSGYLRTMAYNMVTVSVPWEKLEVGPVGEYLEVVDIDPASEAAYEPVDLDDPRLLASDGIAPDEGDPWFHQQMVYAVAMKTVRHFEAALGRPAMWAAGRQREGKEREPFYQRLRIYPHALRERNAYYSPEKRALLFGYFRSPGQGGAPTGPMVFTCLSYDIIAHETTHALLDGMYHHYVEDTNVDMLAFHEAFADIVALFQHFTHPEVLRAAIAETRGDLEADSLLGKLAQQFGEATGNRGALRDAIGVITDGKWQRRQPDRSLLEQPGYQSSPHLRGSILVAAVFDAFLKIYHRRTVSVIRVATGGSGILPPGNIPADLADALSREAAKTAKQILNLCIRALDYLPPVDITFGEYLRAAITADRELVPDDPLGYRVAFVEAFRAWGIQPEGVTTVTPESLCWSQPDGAADQFMLSGELLDHLNRLLPAWQINRSREELHRGTVQAKIRFNQELKDPKNRLLGDEIGINLNQPFEVHTLRPATTLGPEGAVNSTVVVTLLQRKQQAKKPTVRTGSTLIFSRGDGKIRYAIHKRDRRGERADHLVSHKQFRLVSAAEHDPYLVGVHQGEPFAALHLTGHL